MGFFQLSLPRWSLSDLATSRIFPSLESEEFICIPSGAKARTIFCSLSGTAEAVPFQNTAALEKILEDGYFFNTSIS
jgi:hypothetical protein